ncbi:hypothetical protein K438DRAFT_1609506 [Mycena galopus ATCC 62051]|nr:hypothetical protein K438DRAFT_1609506 [Mycena galopus ATCC 62051]
MLSDVEPEGRSGANSVSNLEPGGRSDADSVSNLEPESLVVDPRPESTDPATKPPRSRPRLNVYRILSFALTAGMGAIKAVSSYQGHVTAPTTFDWIYGIVVVSGLEWLGLYGEECPGKLPRWMFETDVVDFVIDELRGVLTRYRFSILVSSNTYSERYHNLTVLVLLQKRIVHPLQEIAKELRGLLSFTNS